MPRPPGDPSFFDKTNYVIDAWANPCVAPWYIYVETLWPALLEAFITLATFGWDDVARGYWRPKGLGRRSGKKRRKGKGRGFPRFPEIGEEIGKRIPTADMVKGRKWGAGGKAIWRIDLAAQRVLFWWLVADVTNDFAYNFTSVLYETVWCQASNLGRFSYSSEENQIIPGGVWWPVDFPDEDYEEPPPVWFFSQGGTGDKSCFVGAGVTLVPHPLFPEPTSWGVAIVKDRTLDFIHKSGPATAAEGGGPAGAVGGNVPPFTAFQVKVWHNAPWALASNAVVFAVENPE